MTTGILLAGACACLCACGLLLYWLQRTRHRNRRVAQVRQRHRLMRTLRRLTGSQSNADALIEWHASRMGVPSYSTQAIEAAIAAVARNRRLLSSPRHADTRRRAPSSRFAQ